MVGQAESLNNSISKHHSQDKSLTLRKMVILTLGLINRPVKKEEYFTFVKNLLKRIPKYYSFYQPSLDQFSALLNKLNNQGVIEQTYSYTQKAYGYHLTDMGEAEYDLIIYNLKGSNIHSKLREFRELVKLAS